MIKAVKKLKFWSRKKRKKKTHQSYYPTPPPPYPPPPPPPPSRSHCCCSCYSSSTQPSAPPLPPTWFDSDPTRDTFFSAPEPPSYSNQSEFREEEIGLDSTKPLYPTLPESSSSYQQYLVPNPVYGIPVSQTARREKSAGVFGCVVNFGIHLIRCFFPCYRICEVRWMVMNKYSYALDLVFRFFNICICRKWCWLWWSCFGMEGGIF